jgi:ribA/ribD-fused uncharacterized protein
MNIDINNQEITYLANESITFKKTKDPFGGLSNMAAGYPLKINRVQILTSEALYQACRFPALPEVQKLILDAKSPMAAKMLGKPHRSQSRNDFGVVNVDIMRWCLRVKLAQNYVTFGKLLASTKNKLIVEESHKDTFWGAVRDKNDPNILRGQNVLGQLLMTLRQAYLDNPNPADLLYIEPLTLPDFNLLGVPIPVIDERVRFQKYLMEKSSK